MKIQLKRSRFLEGGTAKKPTAEQTEYGELCVNYNASDPTLFIKDTSDQIIPVAGRSYILELVQENSQIIVTPNEPPPSYFGELWLDMGECPPVLKVWSDCETVEGDWLPVGGGLAKLNVSAVEVTGLAQTFATLEASEPFVSGGVPPYSLKYTFYNDLNEILQTSESYYYTVTVDDLGRRIGAQATALDSAGNSATGPRSDLTEVIVEGGVIQVPSIIEPNSGTGSGNTFYLLSEKINNVVVVDNTTTELYLDDMNLDPKFIGNVYMTDGTSTNANGSYIETPYAPVTTEITNVNSRDFTPRVKFSGKNGNDPTYGSPNTNFNVTVNQDTLVNGKLNNSMGGSAKNIVAQANFTTPIPNPNGWLWAFYMVRYSSSARHNYQRANGQNLSWSAASGRQWVVPGWTDATLTSVESSMTYTGSYSDWYMGTFIQIALIPPGIVNAPGTNDATISAEIEKYMIVNGTELTFAENNTDLKYFQIGDNISGSGKVQAIDTTNNKMFVKNGSYVTGQTVTGLSEVGVGQIESKDADKLTIIGSNNRWIADNKGNLVLKVAGPEYIDQPLPTYNLIVKGSPFETEPANVDTLMKSIFTVTDVSDNTSKTYESQGSTEYNFVEGDLTAGTTYSVTVQYVGNKIEIPSGKSPSITFTTGNASSLFEYFSTRMNNAGY